MKKVRFASRIIAAASAFALCACAEELNLDNLSTEVTIGQGTTTIPLCYIKNQSLGDMINTESIDGLILNPKTGGYSLSFEGDESTFEIDGISNSFTIPEFSNRFEVAYPQFDMSATKASIHRQSDLLVDMGSLSTMVPSSGSVTIPSGIATPNVTATLHESVKTESLHMVLPEQVKEIKYIIFKDIETGHKGAPVHLSLDLQDFKAINGGGTLSLNVKLTGGQFLMRDAEGQAHYNEYQETYNISSGSQRLDLVLYVEKLSDLKTVEGSHELDIPLELSYDIELDMKTRAGTFSLDKLPILSIDADFEYGDAEISLNDITLVENHPTEPTKVEISGLPKEVESINTIELAEEAYITLYANGFEWLNDTAHLVMINVALPEYFVLSEPYLDLYTYDKSTHTLSTRLDALSHGVMIGIDSIDFGAEGLKPINGVLTLDFTPDFKAYFDGGQSAIMASSLLHDGNLVLNTGIKSATLKPLSVSGRLNYSYQQQEIIQLGEITSSNGISIDINCADFSPVITLNIYSPLTIGTNINATITPMKKGSKIEQNSISLTNVKTTPATYNGSSIVNSEMTIIIADESRRGEFENSGCTFVACNVGKLFNSTLPDALDMNISLSTDATEECKLYIADNFSFAYDYSVNIPLSVTKNLALSYSDVIKDLDEIFKELAEYDIKLADIALLLNCENSIPMQFEAEITALDKHGKPTDVKLGTTPGLSMIKGSKDGVTKAKSTLRLAVSIPNGTVADLSDISAFELKLKAGGSSNEAIQLNKDQEISLDLQLEISGGFTLDFGDL